MPKSSAWGIPYEIRPSKQVERRLVMEAVSLAREINLDPSSLPFIGMGGVRFIDFLLAHKILGVRDFVSLEHDESLWPRCDLNRPFETVEIFRGAASDFLTQRGFHAPALVWFDLEKMASKDAQDDIRGAAAAVKPGSFLFVTATAELPGELESMKMPKRLSDLKDRFGSLANRLRPEWMNKREFHKASAFLARAFLNNGFSGRIDGHYQPLVDIAYRDSSWMVTCGGYFGDQAAGEALRNSVRRNHKFLLGGITDEPFVLEQFNITEQERAIFDRAASSPPRKRAAKSHLRRLGFRDSIIDQYADLMRFIPRYVETVF